MSEDNFEVSTLLSTDSDDLKSYLNDHQIGSTIVSPDGLRKGIVVDVKVNVNIPPNPVTKAKVTKVTLIVG